MSRALSDADYEGLLAFRDQLRRFLHWSEQQSLAHGITPAHYQLLLAIRGHPDGAPTIGEVAEHLLLRHNSVVGLIDRAVAADLVERCPDPEVSGSFGYAAPRSARKLRVLAACTWRKCAGYDASCSCRNVNARSYASAVASGTNTSGRWSFVKA